MRLKFGPQKIILLVTALENFVESKWILLYNFFPIPFQFISEISSQKGNLTWSNFNKVLIFKLRFMLVGFWSAPSFHRTRPSNKYWRWFCGMRVRVGSDTWWEKLNKFKNLVWCSTKIEILGRLDPGLHGRKMELSLSRTRTITITGTSRIKSLHHVGKKILNSLEKIEKLLMKRVNWFRNSL